MSYGIPEYIKLGQSLQCKHFETFKRKMHVVEIKHIHVFELMNLGLKRKLQIRQHDFRTTKLYRKQKVKTGIR